jgi:hypothetical protein
MSSPSRGGRVALIAFAVSLFLIVTLWAWLALSIPLEAGEPCGGDFLNLVQKLIAGAAWIACLVGLAGGLSYQDTGGRWVARGTAATAACFAVWILLIATASC